MQEIMIIDDDGQSYRVSYCQSDKLSQLFAKHYGTRGTDLDQKIYDLFPLNGDKERGINSGINIVDISQLEIFFISGNTVLELIVQGIVNVHGANGGIQTAMRIINSIYNNNLFDQLSDNARKCFIAFEEKVKEKGKTYNTNELEKSLGDYCLKICFKNRGISYSLKQVLELAHQNRIFYNYENFQDLLSDEEKLSFIKNRCNRKKSYIY